MRILFCCEFYAPSVGGIQEVMRQLAERLVAHGHEVTVATTHLPSRTFDRLNGVALRTFVISGNLAKGMTGEVDAYRRFVREGGFDVLMVYSAQQWTFDALWPVLGEIACPKVFVPCGFSGQYEPGYAGYYAQMPGILAQLDMLVFNATRYRDIDMARAHGLERRVVLPNGASEVEFGVGRDEGFRARHGIAADAFVFLTVGSFTGLKGHQELVTAFQAMPLAAGRRATLVLNGNEVQRLERGAIALARKFAGVARLHGVSHALRQVVRKLMGATSPIRAVADAVNASQPGKQVLITDLPRAELTQAFMNADLFVFASNIEYSPLVLFESAAAGTPFLTVDVGNAVEIAQWTGAGVACPSSVDARGYTRVDENVLAREMGEWMQKPEELAGIGREGRRNWAEKFTWEKVAASYEQLFRGLVEGRK